MNRASRFVLLLVLQVCSVSASEEACLLQQRVQLLADSRPVSKVGPTYTVEVPEGVGLRKTFAGVGDRVAILDLTKQTEARLLAESPAFAANVTNLGVSKDGRVALVAAGSQLALLDARVLDRLTILPVPVLSASPVAVYSRISNGFVVKGGEIFFATMNTGTDQGTMNKDPARGFILVLLVSCGTLPGSAPIVSVLSKTAVGSSVTQVVWPNAKDKLYAATPEGVAVLRFHYGDVTALEVEEIIPAGTNSSDGMAISSCGSYAYIAAGTDGLQVVDLRLRRNVGSHRIEGWSGGIVLDPRGNALVAANPGLLSFDIARPASPQLLHQCDVHLTSGGGYGWNLAWGGTRSWSALLADSTGGLQVIRYGLQGMEVTAHFGMGTLARCLSP